MIQWNAIELKAGHHASSADGLCLMEAVALFAGERHGDYPDCCCPSLVEWGRVLNDQMPDGLRTSFLLPLIPLLVDTREPGCTGDGLHPSPLERRRAAALVAWCVNTLPSKRSARDSEEARCCAAELGDAGDHLAAGQAQHASRAAARAVAWTAKGVWHRSLGEALARPLSPSRAAEEATCATLAVWQEAVDAFRRAALLGRAVPVEIAARAALLPALALPL